MSPFYCRTSASAGVASIRPTRHALWSVSRAFLVALVVAPCVGGCVPSTATPYQPDGIAGGFENEHVDGVSWRVCANDCTYTFVVTITGTPERAKVLSQTRILC
jgi:hypothetical protein